MAELVTIPIAVFEIVTDYERPELALWVDRKVPVHAIFDALKPWSPNVDDMEARTTGKISEHGVNFKLPNQRVAFFFGPTYCTFIQEAASWQNAAETLKILTALHAALTANTSIVLAARKTSIALHIQPRTLRFNELLRPFLPVQIAALEAGPVRTMAVIAKWDKRRVTLDGSGALANGIFVRLEREFDNTITYDQMAIQLKQDEDQLFQLLGIEEDLK
jgi:hypothetical protein